MTGSVALDVVIGLVFVYLLYSLLTTTLTEIIASWLQLRASFLVKGIKRMLDDGSGSEIFSDKFFKQPLIKYLGSVNLFGRIKKPAYLSAQNFSKNLLDALKEEGQPLLNKNSNASPNPSTLNKIQAILNDQNSPIAKSETVKYIQSLLDDAQNDLEKFKASLEQWYDDTMERVTGWYKRRIQFFTFFIGFGIAVAFNADTLSIVNTLSKDPKAREQMVQLASAYIDKHPRPTGTDSTKKNPSLDSLLTVKKEIEKDVREANSILGLGWAFPKSVPLFTKARTDTLMKHNKSLDFFRVKIGASDTMSIQLTGQMNEKVIPKLFETKEDSFLQWLFPIFYDASDDYYEIDNCTMGTTLKTNRWKFFWTSFWGYLLTAIALSLGAPFWFDLLNKLVKLRSSVQVTSQCQSQQNAQNKSISTLKIHG